MEDIKVLKNIPLFSTLTQMELVQVAKSVHNHRMKKGTLIIEEGSEEGSLFVLKTGSASVYRITQRGEKKILGRFSAGVLDEDSELLEVKKEDFQGMMAADMKLKCKLQEGMMNDLCHKLRRTNDILLLME
jgi:CRP-like cAMP-binding protein